MNAQPSLFDPPPRTRKDSLQAALTLLRVRGSLGLTEREFVELAGFSRLAGRVDEIREEFGDDYVLTVWERNGNGGRHARYVIQRQEHAAA